MDAYATAVVPNVYHNTIVVIDGARTHDMDLLEQMIRHGLGSTTTGSLQLTRGEEFELNP